MATDGRLKELKSALRDVLADNDAIVNHAAANREEGGPEIQVEAKHVQSFQANLAKAREIRAEIEALEGMGEIRSWAEGMTAPVAQTKSGLIVPQGAKTLGEQFIESDEFKAISGGRSGYTMHAPFQVKGSFSGYWGRKDVYTALPSGTPGDFGTPQREGIVERQKRTMRVRELFDVQQTSTNMIEYFRVSGFTNNASTVAERDGANFAQKPKSSMTVVGVQAPVRTIAHYEVAHRNVLDDEPTLRGIIDSELLYGLRLVEDDQILNGDGTGQNLTGIRETAGIQTFNWSDGEANDTRLDAIRLVSPSRCSLTTSQPA